MRRTVYVLISIVLLSTLPLAFSQSTDNSTDSYSISGTVYDADGQLAGSTSIKLSGYDSIWTDSSGNYQITGIPGGEYSIRAYFMNNGHIAVYRKIILDADLELDWVVAKNWITIDTDDNLAEFTVTSVDSVETKTYSEIIEFGPYDTGQYYTIDASYGDGQERHIVAKLHQGSASEPYLNHLSLDSNMNCKFGYVTDMLENPIENVAVNFGDRAIMTDNDGFYSTCSLLIGSELDVSVKSGDIFLVSTSTQSIDNGIGWHNFTSEIIPEVPEQPVFITQSFDTPIDEFTHDIEWTIGDYTDFVELYIDGELAYRGFNNNYSFTPANTGSYEFRLLALNPNGTTEASKTLTIVVLGNSGSGFWNVGMEWQYAVDFYPASSDGTHNLTMTVVGTEPQMDAFGIEQECYLMRVADEYDTSDQIRYHWIDTDNLLKVRTYSETSTYFVDGTMGWQYTTESGEETNLFSDSVHSVRFNRTNIIGVPGHPNGYDDTNNTVVVTENVLVSTPSGDYLTTHYRINDNDDSIDSWELYYNETVRNWVKIVDRLPGSHSESVTYHLIDYSGIPLQPQFVTENQTVSTKQYLINWGPFGSAMSYELFQDGVSIYTGTDTSFLINNQPDGEYEYQVTVTLFSGTKISSNTISIEVYYVVPIPELNLPYAQELDTNDGLYISWTKTVEADWYSLHHTSPDGMTTEVYNGTDNFVTFSELEKGQNRFRANLGFDGGKFSELSNSSYVNYVPESDNDSDKLNFLTFITVLTVVLIAVRVRPPEGDLGV